MQVSVPSKSLLIPIAAAALIDSSGRVLVQKRPLGKPLAGLWEFPGGKIEPDESPEQALIRELDEELRVTVAIEDVAPLTFATETISGGTLMLLLYIVRRWKGVPEALAADALLWCTPTELLNLDMPPADVPLVARLIETLSLDPQAGLPQP